MSDVFSGILGQPKVRDFLRSVVAQDAIGQAYLFTGPAGSNKTLAAYALAQAAICEDKACGTCEACKRVMRRNHPDVRYYEPEGSGGYLVEQIREIVADVDMAPIQAKRKVYIIDRVDLLSVQAANAFLKTLEEPPANVVLILLGRTQTSVLPTIVSRCQVVPFRHIPHTEAVGIVCQNTGVAPLQAAVAIQACSGSISKAIDFVRSSERFAFRSRVLQILESLELADDLDILEYATELLDRAQAPLDLVRKTQEEELAASAEFMAQAAIRQVEARNKRVLSAKSTETLHQTTSIMRSWLRDVLMVCSGQPELVINEDVRDAIERTAAKTSADRLVRALSALDETDEAFRYNVSPETCIDVALFTIREELYGSHSARVAAK